MPVDTTRVRREPRLSSRTLQTVKAPGTYRGLRMPPPRVNLPRLRLPLRTPRLLLRAYSLRDPPRIARWLSDREVSRTIPLWPQYDLADGTAFVRSARATLRSGDGYRLAIAIRGSGEYVGSCGLEIRSLRDRRAHIGYWVARPFWGQGIASEAASRLCQEAFRTLRLHRIETGVVRGNPASRAVLRRLGFRSEGWARENFRVDGEYRDCEMMGLLAREFRPYTPPPGPVVAAASDPPDPEPGTARPA